VDSDQQIGARLPNRKTIGCHECALDLDAEASTGKLVRMVTNRQKKRTKEEIEDNLLWIKN
jgi:hypothetical protein